METVSLSTIVMKVVPELQQLLTDVELDYLIVLRYGIDSIGKEDAWEIIHNSIYKHQEQAPLH